MCMQCPGQGCDLSWVPPIKINHVILAFLACSGKAGVSAVDN